VAKGLGTYALAKGGGSCEDEASEGASYRQGRGLLMLIASE